MNVQDHHLHHHHHLQQQQQQFQDQGSSDQVVVSNGMEMQLSNSISYASHSHCPNNGNLILPPPPLPPNVARPVTIIRSTSDSMGGLETDEGAGVVDVSESGYETKEFFKKYDSLHKTVEEKVVTLPVVVIKRRAKKKQRSEMTTAEGDSNNKEWISTDLNNDLLQRGSEEKKFKSAAEEATLEEKKGGGELEKEQQRSAADSRVDEECGGQLDGKRRYRKYTNGGGGSALNPVIEVVEGKHSLVDPHNNGIGTSISLLTEFSFGGGGGATATTLQMYSPSHGPTAAASFIATPQELYVPFQGYEQHTGHILSVDAAGDGQEMIIPTNLCLYPTTTAATIGKSGAKQGLHRLTAGGGFLINNNVNNNCDSENEDFLMDIEHQQQQQQRRVPGTHNTEICIMDPNGMKD